METLTTSTAIRSALGDDYQALVDKYDRKAAERWATRKAASELRPYQCAICSRAPPAVLRLEAAHISPLSECATTCPENLVLLCREKEKRQDDVGCHTLFDDGYCSINVIEQCKAKGGVHQEIREQMLATRAKSEAGSQQRGHLKKALAELRAEQRTFNPRSEDWHLRQIRIAELTRRRAKKDALARALHEFSTVEPASLDSPIPQSRLFYERGYVNLLAGELETALSDFKRGREILGADLSDPRRQWRWAAHTALMGQVSCVLRIVQPRPRWSWSTLREELLEALKQAELAAGFLAESDRGSGEVRLARGWVQNCTIHLAIPALAMSDFSDAMQWWQKANSAWRNMDVSSGWDVAARVTLLSLYGRIVLGDCDPKQAVEAMPYLVRALVLLIGTRRQQPEGVREILFAIARGVRALGTLARSKRLEYIADRCRDFSSWINPYVPPRVV